MNVWTRDDLPKTSELVEAADAWEQVSPEAVEHIEAAVVDHLNEHHPKPEKFKETAFSLNTGTADSSYSASLDPADADPGKAYMVTFDGSRYVGIRHDIVPNHPWTTASLGSYWTRVAADSQVSDLVELVPVDEVERLRGEVERLTRERDGTRTTRDHYRARAEEAEAKLAERPTLDRDEVMDALNNTLPRPDDIRVTEQKNGLVFVGTTAYGGAAWILDEYRAKANELIREAAEVIAVVRFIERRESEQNATDDENQRVEEQARSLHAVMAATSRNYLSYDDMHEEEREAVRAVIRAGWTPPKEEK